VNSIIDEGVVKLNVLAHEKLTAFLGSDTSEEGAHSMQFAVTEAKNFSQVLVINGLVLVELAGQLGGLSLEKRELLIDFGGVFTQATIALLSDGLIASHSDEPGSWGLRVEPLIRNVKVPVWFFDFVLDRPHPDYFHLRTVLTEDLKVGQADVRKRLAAAYEDFLQNSLQDGFVILKLLPKDLLKLDVELRLRDHIRKHSSNWQPLELFVKFFKRGDKDPKLTFTILLRLLVIKNV